jgi:hypothetical protein
MSNYICWTKHGERSVIMEEDEKEGDDDNMIIRGFAEYGCNNPGFFTIKNVSFLKFSRNVWSM